MSLKDWITITLSICAFIVAAGTAYLNLLRRTDDLSLVVISGTSLWRDAQDQKLRVGGQLSTGFINNGNRSAAIMGGHLWISQWDKSAPPSKDKRCSTNRVWIRLDTQPFVMKPGDITINTSRSTGHNAPANVTSNPDSTLSFPIADSLTGSVKRLLVCIAFDFSTPVTRHDTGVFELYEYEVSEPSGHLQMVHAHFAERPHTLVWRWGHLWD